MSAVKLPHALEEKLGELAQQVRRLWFYRGMSWFALAFFGSALALIQLDARLDLPGWGRSLLLFGWLVVQAVAFRRLVIRPLRSQIPVPLLAAAIEDQFPNLSERLTTLVELSENMGPGNGSKALVDVLARDTAQRAKKLNFFKAAPTGSVLRFAALAFVIAAAILSPLFFIPGAADRVRRYLMPWAGAKAETSFKVVVSSKDIVAKRNDAVTLTGYLERTAGDAPLPETATLVYKEAGGDEKKLPTTGDEKAAFSVTRPGVKEDFEYCLEAGGVRSDWHKVAVVDAVELTDGTTFTITPPKYAAGIIDSQKQQGLHEFEALQYSRVTFDLRFDRPARSASFEWKPTNAAAQVVGEQFFANLNADRTGGTADWMLVGEGTLKLVLVGERDVRTEVVVATKATPDTPPKFEKVTGVSDKQRQVRPNERVPIEVAVADDLKVDKLELQFEVNADPATRQVRPVTIKDVGTPRAEGRYSFDLADRGKEGDTIRFRIRAVDNRSVPEFNLRPQEVFFPEKGWSELRIDRSAKPLAEQDILAKRDQIKEKLDAARKAVADAQKDVEQVKREAADQEALAPDQVAKLDNAKAKAKEATRELDELAREAGLTPDFRPLANEIKDVEEGALRQADEGLRKAQNEADRTARNEAVADAAKNLDRAKAKIDDLTNKADETAQNLRNKHKLEELADKQKELAEELKSNPGNDRVAREVAKKQQELNAELDQLMKDDPALKKAVEQMQADKQKELAENAKKLADRQKQLEQAAKDQAEVARKTATEEVGRKQKELNAKADRLRKQTADGAKAAGGEQLPKEPFDKADDQIGKGNAVEAMTEQEKAAKELDKLADSLEKAAADRKDPKKAARQLAKLEDELRKKAGEQKNPSDELRKKREKGQDAVRRATEKLSTPPGDKEAEKAKQDALEKLDRAKQAAADDPAKAPEAMKDAADALDRLADKLPGREERTRQAKVELEKLQKEQDAIQKEIDEKSKGFDKKKPDAAARKEAAEKLADAAKRQQELAEKIEQLDAPGLEKRRDKAAEAAKQAADDPKAGRTQDTAASQQQAKRQQEQLRQALDGQTPNDQKADELAKKQKEIADQIERAGGKPDATQLQRLQEAEREVGQQLAQVNDPAAAEQLSRTKEAIKKAEQAMQKNDADELKKKTKEAAEQLDRLADQLAGAEGDKERAERLAKQQEAAADKAQKQAGKPSTPEQTEAAKDELQREIEELKQTRAGDAQEAKKQAADAIERLRREPNPERAAKLQKDAADATRKLSDEMHQKGDQTAKKEQADRGDPDSGPPGEGTDGLPSKADAQQARGLAKEERELRNELAKAGEKGNQGPKATDNKKVDELAKKQQDLADQAGELAKEAGKQEGGPAEAANEAAKQAQEAADQMKAGAPDRAQAAGEKAQKAMEQAAQAGGDTPAGKQAKGLAEKQKQLNREAAEKGQDAGAAAAQQQARQGDLAKQAGDLADKLDEAAKDPGPANGEKMKKAADAARDAQKQMERAEREEKAGRKQNAEDARKQADKALDEAKKQAGEAGGGESGDQQGPKPGKNAQKAGQSVKEAEGQMDQAGKELGKKKPGEAQKAMEKAADKLNEAAKQLGEGEPEPGTGKPGNQSSARNNDGSGKADPSKADLPKDLQQYLGKPWGELPGDVKSKIIQDLQAKYGEDYARVIKLYFEQIAEKK